MRLLFGRPIELLCFDLDDTLLDTEAGAPARFEAAVSALHTIRPGLDVSLVSRAVEHALVTHPTEGRVANFLADVGVVTSSEIEVVRAAYFHQMAERASVVDGVMEALAALGRHFRLAIVTNGTSDLQRQKLAQSGLGALAEWIVISGEVGVEKPDQAIFAHVGRLTGIAAERTAHVGDSLVTDVAGANAAGVMAIWLRSSLVRTRPDSAAFTPHAVIAHVRELVPET